MVRVVVIVKWGSGLTNNSRFCRHDFIRFHDEATVKDKVKEKDVNIPPFWYGDVCKVKVSTDRKKAWTEGRRYFVCSNYAYDRALPTNAYDQPPVSSRSKMLLSNVCQH